MQILKKILLIYLFIVGLFYFITGLIAVIPGLQIFAIFSPFILVIPLRFFSEALGTGGFVGAPNDNMVALLGFIALIGGLASMVSIARLKVYPKGFYIWYLLSVISFVVGIDNLLLDYSQNGLKNLSQYQYYGIFYASTYLGATLLIHWVMSKEVKLPAQQIA